MQNSGMSDVLTSNKNMLGSHLQRNNLDLLREQFENVALGLQKDYTSIQNLIKIYSKIEQESMNGSSQMLPSKAYIETIKSGLYKLYSKLEQLESQLCKCEQTPAFISSSLWESAKQGRVIIASIRQSLGHLGSRYQPPQVSEPFWHHDNHSKQNSEKVKQSEELLFNHQQKIPLQAKKVENCQWSDMESLNKLLENNSLSLAIKNIQNSKNVEDQVKPFSNIQNVQSITSEYCGSNFEGFQESGYLVGKFSIHSHLNSLKSSGKMSIGLVSNLPSAQNKNSLIDQIAIEGRTVEQLLNQLKMSFHIHQCQQNKRKEEQQIQQDQKVLKHSESEKKIPNTFKECLDIEGHILENIHMASGFLSARTRSKFKQIKDRCFSKTSRIPQQKPLSTALIRDENMIRLAEITQKKKPNLQPREKWIHKQGNQDLNNNIAPLSTQRLLDKQNMIPLAPLKQNDNKIKGPIKLGRARGHDSHLEKNQFQKHSSSVISRSQKGIYQQNENLKQKGKYQQRQQTFSTLKSEEDENYLKKGQSENKENNFKKGFKKSKIKIIQNKQSIHHR